MGLYKYMSAEGGLRFLRSWYLRITPPADFNDPFELRAPAGGMFTESFVNDEFAKAAPQMIADDMISQLTPVLSPSLTGDEIQELVAFLLPGANAQLERKVRKKILRKIPALALRIQAMRQNISRGYPTMMRHARLTAATILPLFNSSVQKVISKAPAMLGVLCLSRHSNQPLMWAHYADNHRGLMIEFDDSHLTFHRKRSAVDELGYLRPVVYSKKRPKLSLDEFDLDKGFEVFALTKSHHWSYEEESRLLWPLTKADKQVETPGGAISLISCPPDAVLTITLGCNASLETVAKVQDAVSQQKGTQHMSLWQARLDDLAFDLIYAPVSASHTPR